MLKSFVSSALSTVGLSGVPSSFKYTVGQPLDSSDSGAASGPSAWVSSYWTLYSGRGKQDNKEVTIFVCNKKAARPRQVEAASNFMTRIRSLRHPYVLQCLDTAETDAAVYIAAEKCVPLLDHRCTDNDPPVWGLYQIICALHFLHADAKMVHGWVDPTAVFVTSEGAFKLGMFALSQPLQDANVSRLLSDRNSIADFQTLAHWPTRPSENQIGAGASAGVVDLYGLASVVVFCLEKGFNNVTAYNFPGLLEARVPSQLQQVYRELVACKARDSVAVLSKLVRLPWLVQHPQVAPLLFLSELHIQRPSAKEHFVQQTLPSLLDTLPPSLQTGQLLSHLAATISLPEMAAGVVVCMLRIGQHLSPERFNAELLPVVLKLFSAPDRAIRYRLLSSVDMFIEQVDSKVIETQIFPECLPGFTDSHAAIREQTLKSVVSFLPKLSAKTITQKVLGHMQKLLQDSEPGIRTNTVICFGKIASQLPPADADKILSQAFIAGLKDPFPHCRLCSIQAVSACLEFAPQGPDTDNTGNDDITSVKAPSLLALDSLSGQLLPLVSMRLADPDPMVQDAAHAAMPLLIKTTRDLVIKRRAAEAEAAAAAVQKDGTHGARMDGKTPTVMTATAPTTTAGGWGSWAFSKVQDFSGRLTSHQSQAPPTPSNHQDGTARNERGDSQAVSVSEEGRTDAHSSGAEDWPGTVKSDVGVERREQLQLQQHMRKSTAAARARAGVGPSGSLGFSTMKPAPPPSAAAGKPKEKTSALLTNFTLEKDDDNLFEGLLTDFPVSKSAQKQGSVNEGIASGGTRPTPVGTTASVGPLATAAASALKKTAGAADAPAALKAAPKAKAPPAAVGSSGWDDEGIDWDDW